MLKIICCLQLLLLFSSCESIIINNGFDQEEIAKQYLHLLQSGKHEKAYNFLDDAVKKKISLQDFIVREQFYLKLIKRYGEELKFVRSENTFDDKKIMCSNLYFALDSKLNRLKSNNTNLLFRFKGGEIKILEVKFFFNDLKDRIMVPFEIEKCNNEKIINYFDKWYINGDTMLINSVSLLTFSENIGMMVVKVVCNFPDNIPIDSVRQVGTPIAKYAFQKRYYEIVKKEAEIQKLDFNTDIGITFWRPVDGMTYSVKVSMQEINLR